MSESAKVPAVAPLPAHVIESRPLISPKLADFYARAAARRAAAFVDAPELVAGLALAPLTPDRYSVLSVAGNLLLARPDKLPPDLIPTFKDLRDFCWVLSSDFTADGTDHRGVVARLTLTRYLFRRLRSTPGAALARLLLPLLTRSSGRVMSWLAGRLRRWARPPFSVALALACEEARAIVAEAFADAPIADEEAPDVGLGLTAQFTDLFAAEYQWPFATSIGNTPLKKLFGLLRACRIRNGGRAALAASITREEAALLVEVLDDLAPSAPPAPEPSVPSVASVPSVLSAEPEPAVAGAT